MTIATYYAAIYRQIETGLQITFLSTGQPLPVSPVGEIIEISDGAGRIAGQVARYSATITTDTSSSGNTNRTFVHQYDVALHLAASPEVEQQIADAIASFETSKGRADPATIWAERVTVRNPVGKRVAMGTGQTQMWSPQSGAVGAIILGQLTGAPPADPRAPLLAVDFTAVAGRHYVLAVECANSGGEAQITFLDRAYTSPFGDLRVQRTSAAVIGISDVVTPEQAGPAAAFLGWHGFEDEIVAASIHELQL